ncbi:hypothetical protein RvY_13457 [Ramazzottius varieornatus]|uniref:Uncharacterized protein n=1 Tax=Ramazzottius varieornatus TaxID=947166 RepID=A0A1D1VMY3_RAMVA|nr:hypothetical protein RvY_13457 [Ramazzottius varieornatus]
MALRRAGKVSAGIVPLARLLVGLWLTLAVSPAATIPPNTNDHSLYNPGLWILLVPTPTSSLLRSTQPVRPRPSASYPALPVPKYWVEDQPNPTIWNDVPDALSSPMEKQKRSSVRCYMNPVACFGRYHSNKVLRSLPRPIVLEDR